MLLAIDIGNTNINLGLFKGKRLIKKYLLTARRPGYANRIKQILRNKDIDAIIICSVVPKVTAGLKQKLLKITGKKPLVVGQDIKVPIKNRYRYPKQVGQDRLVGAYASTEFYGSPSIVIDLGTAITIDVISKNKEYLGGMIFPGLSISLDALFEKTALLPKVTLKKPKEFIGKDTVNSITSGIVYGFSALISDLSRRLRVEIGKNARVIGTGGGITLIANYTSCFYKIDKSLILKGINLLWQNKGRHE